MKRILTIFLLLFSINGYCEWIKVIESDSSVTFIEPSTIKRTGKTIRSWELFNFNSPQPLGNKRFSSIKGYTETDCSEEKRRDLSSIYYSGSMGDGEVVFKYDSPGEWKYFPPDSVASSMIKLVCKTK